MALKEFRSICLPYCLQKQDDGSYITLNREYKPLGFNSEDWVDYSKYPIATKYKGLTKQKISKISFNGNKDEKIIFLYNDACIPTKKTKAMKSYLERLAILAKLKRA